YGNKLPFYLSDYFFRYRFRNLLVVIERHGVGSTTLRGRTKISCISKHLRQRNHGTYHLGTGTTFHAHNPSAARVEITNDITHIFFRNNNLDRHDRLKEYR
ncbi:hypothetical protein GeomeDRAFT_3260, partial [Geobacter metallireducens RCH3]